MISVLARFLKKVSIRGIDDCWEWLAYKDRNGYGQFNINGKVEYAHRASWMLNNGQIPDGLCVLHSCDNPPCVNKNHLFLGTRADNSHDMVQKGRQSKGCPDLACIPRGESHYNAKLSENDVKDIRRLCISGDRRFGQSQLSRNYGISRRNIGKIVNRESWNHI